MNTVSSPTALEPNTPIKPWYRYPTVWLLVIAGPAIVVLASLYTAGIAYKGMEAVMKDPPLAVPAPAAAAVVAHPVLAGHQGENMQAADKD